MARDLRVISSTGRPPPQQRTIEFWARARPRIAAETATFTRRRAPARDGRQSARAGGPALRRWSPASMRICRPHPGGPRGARRVPRGGGRADPERAKAPGSGRGHRAAKHFYSIFQKMKAGRRSRKSTTCSACASSRTPATMLRRSAWSTGPVRAGWRPVQGLHREAEEQHVPVAPHHRGLCGGEMVEVQIRTRECIAPPRPGSRLITSTAGWSGRRGTDANWAGSSPDRRLQHTDAATSTWTSCAPRSTRRRSHAYTPPARELKRLPKGSTPLDFAFLIHTEVGQTPSARA